MTSFSSDKRDTASRIMSNKLHTSSPPIFIDHSKRSEVYTNKNTEGLENGADKTFIKTSILLHQRSDSYAEALHPINLNSEMNPFHLLKESTERSTHSFDQDLEQNHQSRPSPQTLSEDTRVEQTSETSEYSMYEVRADYCVSEVNAQSKISSDSATGGEKTEVLVKTEAMVEVTPYNNETEAHQDPVCRDLSYQMLRKADTQCHESQVDSGKPNGENEIDMENAIEHENGVRTLVIASKDVENIPANVHTHEESNLLEPDDESRIRAELEMEIERDLEREIKAKIVMLNQRLEHLQSKRHVKEDHAKDSKPVSMGGNLRNSQIEHLKEVIKEETLPKSSLIEGKSATQLLLQREGSIMHPKSAPSSMIGEVLPNLSFIKTEKAHANDQDGLFLYGEIPNMHPNYVREFPSGIIDALLDKDVQLSYTETHTIQLKKVFDRADQSYHKREILQKSKHNKFEESPNSTKANHDSVGGSPAIAEIKHSNVGGSPISAKSKHNSFEGYSINAKARYNSLGGSPMNDKAKDSSSGESPTSVKAKLNIFGVSPARIKAIPNTFSGSPIIAKGKQNIFGGSPTSIKAKQNTLGGSPTCEKLRHNSFGGPLASDTTKPPIAGESLTCFKRLEASSQHTNVRTKKKFDWTQTLRSDSPPARLNTHVRTAKDNWNNAVARTLFQDDVPLKGSPVSKRFTEASRNNNSNTNTPEKTKDIASEECKRSCYQKPPLAAKLCQETHNTFELNATKGRYASKTSSPLQQFPRKAVNKPMVWK